MLPVEYLVCGGGEGEGGGHEEEQEDEEEELVPAVHALQHRHHLVGMNTRFHEYIHHGNEEGPERYNMIKAT